MKKVFICLFSILCLFVTGCSTKQEKENELDKFAKDYYKRHMAGIANVNKVEITLEAIRKVAIQNEYKINNLKKCNDETKVTYTIKDGKIEDKKFVLKCH